MEPIITVDRLTMRYPSRVALRDVSLTVPRTGVFAIIGPAGAGKSSLMRCLNRAWELDSPAQVTGRVALHGVPVESLDPVLLRRRVAYVMPLPVGLPLSIYDNVALGPRLAGERRREVLEATVEAALRGAALWDEVKDRLSSLGTMLSGGQQQRLALARALSTQPEVLCLDEFSIAIDPVTTMRIEEVLRELSGTVTVVLVTNLLGQARRLAARTAFLLDGCLVEEGPTDELFRGARDERTRDYVEGRFG